MLENLIIRFAVVTLMALVLLICVRKRPIPRKICLAVLITTLTLSILLASVGLTAANHGALPEIIKEYTLADLLKGIGNSHAQRLPESREQLADAYVLYYKFTCPDCQNTYHELQNWLGTHDIGAEIYYVPSNSEYGKELMQDFPVSEVPSLVYIYPNGSTYYTRKTYTETEDSEGAQFFPAALEDIISLRNEVVSP